MDFLNYFPSDEFGDLGIFFMVALPLLWAWSLAWKGLALWHAAQRKESAWFIAILLINSLGIFEIFYLFVIAKVKRNALLK